MLCLVVFPRLVSPIPVPSPGRGTETGLPSMVKVTAAALVFAAALIFAQPLPVMFW